MVDMVVLEMVHEVCTVTFHLFIRRYGTEDYLSETLRGEHPETDSSNHTTVLQ